MNKIDGPWVTNRGLRPGPAYVQTGGRGRAPAYPCAAEVPRQAGAADLQPLGTVDGIVSRRPGEWSANLVGVLTASRLYQLRGETPASFERRCRPVWRCCSSLGTYRPRNGRVLWTPLSAHPHLRDCTLTAPAAPWTRRHGASAGREGRLLTGQAGLTGSSSAAGWTCATQPLGRPPGWHRHPGLLVLVSIFADSLAAATATRIIHPAATVLQAPSAQYAAGARTRYVGRDLLRTATSTAAQAIVSSTVGLAAARRAASTSWWRSS